jgi:hypothetical protein
VPSVVPVVPSLPPIVADDDENADDQQKIPPN